MVQWRIFSEFAAQDKKEQEELYRDIAEYAMAFHNYDAVKTVQEAREQRTSQDETQEDIFLKQVEQMFGKKLDKETMEDARTQVSRREAPKATRKTTRQGVTEDLIRITKDPKKE